MSKPQEHDQLDFNTTSNYITSFRVVLVPIVVGLMFLKNPLWDGIATAVFVVAAISDYFDGYIARLKRQVTVFGKLMDPIADKFLVTSILIMLQYLERIHPIVVILLVCREIAITGLRALASEEGLKIMAASRAGQLKTATQMIAIPFLMVKVSPFGIPCFQIALWLLWISLGISLWSAQDYIVEFIKEIRAKARERKLVKKQMRAAKRTPKQ